MHPHATWSNSAASLAVAGLYTGLSYILGSLLSASAGYLGMMIATSANGRTTEACTTSISSGLRVSFAAGAVMGNGVVGLALIGLWALYLIWTAVHPDSISDEKDFYAVWGYIAGFGFGASSIGMFARVGEYSAYDGMRAIRVNSSLRNRGLTSPHPHPIHLRRRRRVHQGCGRWL